MTSGTLLAAALFVLLPGLAPGSAHADQRQTLGWGHLFDNDALGDLYDRWHSGAFTISVLRGPKWQGELPSDLGDLLEYRVSGSVITAENLTGPAANDRRYVAPLSLGVNTHLNWRGFEASLGADLVSIGPQSGVGGFQTWLHDILNVGKPDLGNQLGNAFHPTFHAELARGIEMSDQISLRPFVAAQTGVETLVRAGGDVVIGSFGKGGLLLRDDTTGQRYKGIQGDATPGVSFTLGGDVAHVFSSALLPEGGAVEASDIRGRLRAGLAWQGEQTSAFYGITYLSPEFDSQPEGQLVGSVNLNLRF